MKPQMADYKGTTYILWSGALEKVDGGELEPDTGVPDEQHVF